MAPGRNTASCSTAWLSLRSTTAFFWIATRWRKKGVWSGEACAPFYSRSFLIKWRARQSVVHLAGNRRAPWPVHIETQFKRWTSLTFWKSLSWELWELIAHFIHTYSRMCFIWKLFSHRLTGESSTLLTTWKSTLLNTVCVVSIRVLLIKLAHLFWDKWL